MALFVLLYRKGARLDLAASDYRLGEIVSLMSSDINSIVAAITYFNLTWQPIAQLAITLVLLLWSYLIANLVPWFADFQARSLSAFFGARLVFCVRYLSSLADASSVVRRPSSAVRRPSSVVRRPSSIARRPASGVRRPSSAVRRPSSGVRPMVRERRERDGQMSAVVATAEDVHGAVLGSFFAVFGFIGNYWWSNDLRWSFSDSSVAAERRFAIETPWLVHAEVRRFAGRATGWCAALFDGRLRLTRVIWLGIASQTPPRELIQAGVSAFEFVRTCRR